MPRRTRRKLFLLLLMEKKRRGKTAIFMAGSPGAGKTEAAQTLTVLNSNLCVIDADKFRVLFPGYVGNNSDEFQRGSSLLVDAALDLVLKKAIVLFLMLLLRPLR